MSGAVARVVRWRRAVLAEPALTDAQKLVAFALAEHMNGGGGSCWPSVETLADEVALTRRPVQRALATLDAAGWIEREIGRGRGHSSQYRATFPDPEKASDATPISGEKRRRPVHEKASSQVIKGVPGAAQGLQEDDIEDVPPNPPRGKDRPGRADALEDRLAALDIPLRPVDPATGEELEG